MLRISLKQRKKINEDIAAINSEEIDNTYYNWAKSF